MLDTKSKNNRGLAAVATLSAVCGAALLLFYRRGTGMLNAALRAEGDVWEVYYEISRLLEGPSLCLLTILALLMLLPYFRRLRRENTVTANWPLELALTCGGIAVTVILRSGDFCVQYYLGGRDVFRLVLHFAAYTAAFFAWMLSVMSVLRVFDFGWKRYLRERTLTVRVGRWCWKKARKLVVRLWESIRTVDLGDRSDLWLLRIVGVNFLILALCCLIWFWGVLALVVYSVVLFFLLRKYLDQVKADYGKLLEMTSRMAKGDLHASPQEPSDFGIFRPVGEELTKVNEGFRRAVEEEVRSRNMKTELITNVSHDLKTPLTAIITYVNLLKGEEATEEERKSYIEILDRKSLRLKKLIEDLFEISKAASGTIQIRRSQVDLAEMVRQAALEQEDRMAAARIDLRVQAPAERVQLWLDSDKTYRILENLLVNVSKYAMPDTRAWLSLYADDQQAEIIVKNTSAEELEEDSSHFAERFVRGDKSRNTEGSGLGLAIVKSFAELQGGTFRIVTDGDLFKVIVTFPLRDEERKHERSEEPETQKRQAERLEEPKVQKRQSERPEEPEVQKRQPERPEEP